MADGERFALGMAAGIGIGLVFGGAMEFFGTLSPGAGIGIGLALGAGIGVALGVTFNRKSKIDGHN